MISFTMKRGFTLIELLVVIAIIGLLSSIVLASLNSARAKTRDARKQADFKTISTALQLFYDINGRMPNNYKPNGHCEGDGFYERSMQELVDAKVLATIPRSPGGEIYCYYNYGPGSPTIGAIIVTALETVPNTTTGIPPSCRPWAPGANWCSQASSKEYCICNLH